MNWDAVGAVAELLGVLAVFVTLAYLAIQVKYAKDQVQLSIQQVRNSSLRELYLALAQNSGIASAMSKAEQVMTPEIESEKQLFEAAEFSPEEIAIWQSYQRAWWVHWREVIDNRDELSKSQLEHVNLGIATIFTKSSARVYLNSMGSIKSSTIRYIESQLQET
jgi:hypothetical protein